jgi:hypothetical protein
MKEVWYVLKSRFKIGNARSRQWTTWSSRSIYNTKKKAVAEMNRTKWHYPKREFKIFKVK